MWSESLQAERPLGKSTGKGRKSGRDGEGEASVTGVCAGGVLRLERRGLKEEGEASVTGNVQGGVFGLRDVIRKKRESLPSHGVCTGESSG